MPEPVVAILLYALVLSPIAYLIVAAVRTKRKWAGRPSVLRAFASRRGFTVVENPGTPDDLAPIRPLTKRGPASAETLSLAIRGRMRDSELTLFDIRTELTSQDKRRHETSYETLLTIRSTTCWPHFEFAVMSNPTPDSFAGILLSAVGSLADITMGAVGMTRVPIPERPGCLLFVADAASGDVIRDAILRSFGKRMGWWVGARENAIVFHRMTIRKGPASDLVPAGELGAMISEATAIERILRATLVPRAAVG